MSLPPSFDKKLQFLVDSKQHKYRLWQQENNANVKSHTSSAPPESCYSSLAGMELGDPHSSTPSISIMASSTACTTPDHSIGGSVSSLRHVHPSLSDQLSIDSSPFGALYQPLRNPLQSFFSTILGVQNLPECSHSYYHTPMHPKSSANPFQSTLYLCTNTMVVEQDAGRYCAALYIIVPRADSLSSSVALGEHRTSSILRKGDRVVFNGFTSRFTYEITGGAVFLVEWTWYL
ncbi:hypothetical protein CPB83DRAFT_899326 [Crepidotus variabilis]|uniref:Uncharacterized protein n=1 Tax=Crepidotus variabilis TaxID=179855 RepID=A0A9P6E5I9_9AGAR|nr:hypothetical protein CPB83DRAFT_899326 [Crepidotus variabilis]